MLGPQLVVLLGKDLVGGGVSLGTGFEVSTISSFSHCLPLADQDVMSPLFLTLSLCCTIMGSSPLKP